MRRKKSDPIAEVHCLVNKLCARKCSVHIVELEISSPASKHLQIAILVDQADGNLAIPIMRIGQPMRT